MLALDLFLDKEKSYIYMERYVNEGSPSGYTNIHKTSYFTNPFTGKKQFNLYKFDDSKYQKKIYGEEFVLFSNDYIFAHPDSTKSNILRKFDVSLECSEFLVIPTASSRTVFIKNDETKGFIKLTYDISRIGRSDRQISNISAMASCETSDIIKNAIYSKKMPHYFGILLEKSAKVVTLKKGLDTYEWGVIYRDFFPYPYVVDDVAMVPSFSLFSRDYNNINDEYLINQFIDLSQMNPTDYLLDLVIKFVDCYWNLLLNCGLAAEMHAQNCLVEIDKKFRISRIIIKDMEDVDRDIYVMKNLNINNNIQSINYKVFDKHDPVYKYRTSYMYDFKFGEYLLKPIIITVCKKYGLNESYFYDVIRKYVRNKYIERLPKNYFSDNDTWYSCLNVETFSGESKKYVLNRNPKFR